MPAARKARASSSATAPSSSSSSSQQLQHQEPEPPSPEAVWTEPPWTGFLETTEDALLILEAARRRLIPRVTRRLADRERRLITSGSVFVFEEEESGIKRWTDGFLWSPSRILGNFLLYRETDKRNPDGTPVTKPGARPHSTISSSTAGPSSLLVTTSSDIPDDPNRQQPWSSTSPNAFSRPRQPSSALSTEEGFSAAGSSGLDRARERILLGSLTNSQKFKEDGMMKKTFSLTLPGTTKTHHLVSYYKVCDVEAGRLRTPSSLPELSALEISPDFLDKTHFRVPPKVEVGEDGRVRFRGETMTTTPDTPETKMLPDLAREAASSSSSVHISNQHSSHHHHSHHHHHHSSSSHHGGHHPTTPVYSRPHGHSHSRQSSISNSANSNANFLAQAAQVARAQADASARMYHHGAAVAAAAEQNTVHTKSHTSSTNPNSAGFREVCYANGGMNNLAMYGTGVNLTMSPVSSPTTTSPQSFTSSGSSSLMMAMGDQRPRSSGSMMYDSSTGAPPFQAPQLYNPLQPSSGANAAFAKGTYPASLAPSLRTSTSGTRTDVDASSTSSGSAGSTLVPSTPLGVGGVGLMDPIMLDKMLLANSKGLYSGGLEATSISLGSPSMDDPQGQFINPSTGAWCGSYDDIMFNGTAGTGFNANSGYESPMSMSVSGSPAHTAPISSAYFNPSGGFNIPPPTASAASTYHRNSVSYAPAQYAQSNFNNTGSDASNGTTAYWPTQKMQPASAMQWNTWMAVENGGDGSTM